jgi:cell wall-associated NlpC family hydrolase
MMLVCVVFATLALANQADARTRRHRRNAPAVLQPIVAAHRAVHAIADPVLFTAPHAVLSVASAPLRVAYHTAPGREAIYHAPILDNEDADEQAEEFAYYTNRQARSRTAPPRDRRELSDEDESDAPRKASAGESEISGGAKPMVAGSRAALRNGIAAAPSSAPASVKNAIWAANSIRRKPYVWGGGHGSFSDRGYNCSGTVSFALHNAGVLNAPLPSSDLERFGERGRGHWITIYTRPGHTFAVIAGLRLDTTDFYNGGNVGPRWHEDMRDTFGYVARHPVGL